MSAAGSPKAAPAPAPAVELEDVEIPDVIERLPKPDKAAHDAAIAKIDETIKKLQARTAVVRAEMDALKTGRGGYGEQIQAAKAVFSELRAAKDNLIQQRNHLTAKVKSTLDKKDSTIKTQKSLRANLRFQTEEEFEKEIRSLRHQQETRSMSLNEEKRLVKDIEALQAQKLQVRALPDDKSEVEKANESVKEIRALQSKKNAEIDAIQEKLTAQKLKLDELYKLNDEEKKQDKFPALAKERKEIKEQLDAEFTQLKQLRADFKAANDKYYENIRLVRKKKELERKKEDERRRLEYEAKLSEYEKEMAKIHPYQDEQDLCDALVSFLEKTYAKELKEEADEKTEASAATAAAPATLDGLQPLQRKDEEFMSFGGGKKGKKGGKKEGAPKKAKRDAKLSLQMAQLDAYSSIGLVPPSTVSALSDSLKAIKEKKEWYAAQTERPKKAEPVAAEAPASPTAAAAPAAKSSPKKKSNKKFNAVDKNAFPTLGGVDAAPSSPKSFGNPAWGPGMAPPAPAYSSFISQPTEEDETADYDN